MTQNIFQGRYLVKLYDPIYTIAMNLKVIKNKGPSPSYGPTEVGSGKDNSKKRLAFCIFHEMVTLNI